MRKFKKPYRTNNLITESYNSGIVNIFTVVDSAVPGRKPVEQTIPLISLRYAERKLGVTRYYAAKQNQTEIDRVIRVPRPSIKITNRDLAYTEDGEKYRIDLVQAVEDVYPPSLDITLVKFAQGVNTPLTGEDNGNDME